MIAILTKRRYYTILYVDIYIILYRYTVTYTCTYKTHTIITYQL